MEKKVLTKFYLRTSSRQNQHYGQKRNPGQRIFGIKGKSAVKSTIFRIGRYWETSRQQERLQERKISENIDISTSQLLLEE